MLMSPIGKGRTYRMTRRSIWVAILAVVSALLIVTTLTPAGSQTEVENDGGIGRCTTNTSGYCTQAHGLGKVPTDIQVTAVSGFNAGRASSQTSTNFRIYAYQGSTLKTSTAIVYWWHVWAKPIDTTTTTIVAPTTTTSTIEATTTTLAPVADPVIEGAGDIAGANSDGSFRHQAETADIILTDNPTAVFTLGDNAYPDGTLDNYNAYYDPFWGKFNNVMHPSPGNHEYNVSPAQGYVDYFEPKGVQIRNAQDNGLYYSWGSRFDNEELRPCLLP